MVAYSFKPQFVAPILAGTKAQTIRAPRLGVSDHAYPGQRLQLYRGMRTRTCALILRTVCVGRESVTLRWSPVVEVILGGERLPPASLDTFARCDGFADFDAMEKFWADVHPGIPVFDGQVMRWKPPAGLVEMGAEIVG